MIESNLALPTRPEEEARLERLIMRVEKCAGPDRTIDMRITTAINPGSRITYMNDQQELLCVIGAENRHIHLPHYTASIDAAMTLMPDCYGMLLGTNKALEFPPTEVDLYLSPGQILANATAATPALALCLACLRARLALLKLERPK